METEHEAASPLHILFLEDNVVDADLAERELRRAGLVFTSTRVDTKAGFLGALEEFRPDVIVADYLLPQFDALQALRLTRARDATLPFILLTGAVNEETAVACMKAGATDYLLKERATRLPFAVLEAMETRRAVSARQAAESAQRQTQANLLALITNTDDRIWAVDREYRLIVSNPMFQKHVTSRTRRTVAVGESVLHGGLPMAMRKEWRGYYDRALGGESFSVDRAMAIGSEVAQVEYRFKPIRGADGSVTGAAVFGRDITARKVAETQIEVALAALQESEKLYRELFEAESDAIVLVDNTTGNILEANGAAVALYGYGYSELLKMRNVDLSAEPKATRMVTSETPVDPDQAVSVAKCLHRKMDGTVFPVEITGRFYVREGLPVYLAAIRDVTERERAEEAERDQRALAEALCDTAAALNRTLDFDQVLDHILESASAVVPHDASNVLLIGPEGKVRVARRKARAQSRPPAWSTTRTFSLAAFANLRRVAETQQPLVIPDMRDYPDWIDTPDGGWIRSTVCAPIHWRGQVAGFINLYSGTPRQFSLKDARRLGAFADQAAVALENARLFTEVTNGREQMRALSRRLLHAQESERRHVARELHDEIGQLLTGLKLILQMSAAGEPAGQPGSLAEAEALVGELISRVRQLSLDLRPAMLDDLGLLAALLWHLHRYTAQTQIEVDFRHDDLQGRRFPPEIETAAYRIVQEALTNVARHSSARQATVRVWRDGESLTVQVEDQGAGFDPGPALSGDRSGGLAGMRERAELLGGKMTLETSPGQGTRITATLPLPEPGARSG